MATASRDPSDTDRIICSDMCPIQAISPKRSTASIKTNIAAKNNSVGHSMRDIMASISCFSVMIIKRITPNNADHPNDNRFISGIDSIKNKHMMNKSTKHDFINRGLFFIGNCKR